MKGAKYVIFDGMDGSGKGTQLKLLEEKLGDQVVFTREPGGPPLAEDIRKIIRDNPQASHSTALFHFLMFWAAREESMQKLVMPALRSGKHVFSDRGDSSTFAFQMYGEEQLELDGKFMDLRKDVFGSEGRQPPDLYIIFDLPADVARARVMQDVARSELNHFDVRDLSYYERVRTGFRFLQHAWGLHRVALIDATLSPEEVHDQVRRTLAAWTGIFVPS